MDLAVPGILSAASLCRILAADLHKESCCFLQSHLLKQDGLLLLPTVGVGGRVLSLPCLPPSAIAFWQYSDGELLQEHRRCACSPTSQGCSRQSCKQRKREGGKHFSSRAPRGIYGPLRRPTCCHPLTPARTATIIIPEGNHIENSTEVLQKIKNRITWDFPG